MKTFMLYVILFAGKSVSYIYIDGTDAASEGTFVSNATGRTLTYTNWHTREPSNYNNEDCINMYPQNYGLWNDIACSNHMASVCEIPLCKLTETAHETHRWLKIVEDGLKRAQFIFRTE